MDRKGFPESYDGTAVLRFLSAVKAGQHNVAAPVYSHITYDIVKGESIIVDRPDILIFEGINVLLPNRLPRDGKEIPFVSDFFDFSIFLDADTALLEQWYIERFMSLRDDGVPRSAQLFPPIRRPQRCGSRGDGAIDLAAHQSRQPAREYSADPAPRRLAPDQGREPPDRRSGAEKAVSVWRRSALSACVVLARRSHAFPGACGAAQALSAAPISRRSKGSPRPRPRARTISSTATDCCGGSRSLALRPLTSSAPSIRPTSSALEIARRAAQSINGAKVVATELGGPIDVDRESQHHGGDAGQRARSRPRHIRRRHRARGPRDNREVHRGLGYPAAFAHHLKPWFLAILTALPKCEAEREGLESARGRPVSRRDGKRLGGEGRWT